MLLMVTRAEVDHRIVIFIMKLQNRARFYRSRFTSPQVWREDDWVFESLALMNRYYFYQILIALKAQLGIVPCITGNLSQVPGQ